MKPLHTRAARLLAESRSLAEGKMPRYFRAPRGKGWKPKGAMKAGPVGRRGKWSEGRGQGLLEPFGLWLGHDDEGGGWYIAQVYQGVQHIVGTGWQHTDTMKKLAKVQVDADGWATPGSSDQAKSVQHRYGAQPSKPSPAPRPAAEVPAKLKDPGKMKPAELQKEITRLGKELDKIPREERGYPGSTRYNALMGRLSQCEDQLMGYKLRAGAKAGVF